MPEIKKCAHPACRCMVNNDDKYCSPYCKDAGDEVEISCDCNHPGCGLTESAAVR